MPVNAPGGECRHHSGALQHKGIQMIRLAILIVGIAAILLAAMQVWRLSDRWMAGAVWRQLAAFASADAPRFDPAMLAGLPDPAIRYFTYTIRPGTRLSNVATITMRGDFALGDRQAPNYLPMQARQILAPPNGFVWIMSAGKGLMRVSGSDGGAGAQSWTRFWALGTLPVARTGQSADHARSTFARMAAEALIWTPAALLPGPGINWQAVDRDRAIVTLSHGGFVQAVEITVNADGQPVQVRMDRWSDANADKTYREQPFGATLSEFREFGGYRLATRIDAGNFFGTSDYFPFFRAEVTDIRFAGRD